MIPAMDRYRTERRKGSMEGIIMTRLEEAREFFKADIFATQTTGIVIEEVADGYSRCSLQVEEKHMAAHHHVMGGALFTMADFAFAVAANPPGQTTVTATSNISFVSMPKDDRLVAECRQIKDGRRACYYETRITDGLGNVVAVVTAMGMHMN